MAEETRVTTQTSRIELDTMAEQPGPPDGGGPPVLAAMLPVLGKVKVRVSVQVGSAKTSIAELMALKQGAVMALDRLVDQPLDVLVDDQVVARGMLVAVDEHFGVCITEAATVDLGAMASDGVQPRVPVRPAGSR
jgi:flagellar motor switch protein FliN/FliY